VALSLLALIAICGLVASDEAGIGVLDQVSMCFVFYTLFDISHDCLLVPGRALLSDIAEQVVGVDETEADLYYTRGQSGGRACAMLVGCLPWRHILEGTGVSKFQLLYGLSFVVVILCAVASWVAGAREIPLDVAIEIPLQNVGQRQQEQTGGGELAGGTADQERQVDDSRRVYWLLTAILSVQTTGWISVNALSFWWMPFLKGVPLEWLFDADASFVGLALQAMVGFYLGGQASMVWCRSWGVTAVWLFGEASLAVALGSTWWIDRQCPVLTIALAAVTGINNCMHSALVHRVIQRVVRDPAKRAFYIAVANNTLCVAQIIVAAGSGLVVQHLGDGNVAVLFVLCAGLQAIVLVLAAPMLLLGVNLPDLADDPVVYQTIDQISQKLP